MDSNKEMWALVCENLKQSLGDVIFNIWFASIDINSFDGQTVELVAGELKRKIIEKQFSNELAEAFRNVVGFDIDIQLVDPSNVVDTDTPDTPEGEEELNTFDTFVVGSSNRFAFVAAKAVAEKPVVTYNPLFIYGSSGLGKTHLLCAIRHAILKNNPDANVIMTRGEDFVNLIVGGINSGQGSMKSIHEKFRNCDVLLVDDIQFIAGKPSTQEEFFHTFNALTADNKQIVLTSDRPPKDIEVLEERLRSRFESGLTADIQPPDVETRIAIVKRKASTLGLDIPADVCDFIAEKIKSNVRQLEGAVKKIHALVNLEGSPINIAMAQNAIKDMAGESVPVKTRVDRIINETARTYGVPPQDLTSAKRDAKTAKARQMAIYAVRTSINLTQQEISEYFGGRDRTAILYSIRTVEEEMEKDSSLKRTIENIIKNAQEQ